jgi:response regulator NasT
MRLFYQRVLARLGHQVCLALTGRQLVEQCRLLRPALVVAAVELPDLDGVAAAEAICRDQPTPILLFSGGQTADCVERILDNPHVLACRLKPVKEADLRAAVAVARSRFERFQALCQEATDLRQALEDRKVIERAKGVVMRYGNAGEEEAYRRLRQLASARNGKFVEVARAVLAAGEVFHQLAGPSEADQGGSEGRPGLFDRRKGRSPAASHPHHGSATCGCAPGGPYEE